MADNLFIGLYIVQIYKNNPIYTQQTEKIARFVRQQEEKSAKRPAAGRRASSRQAKKAGSKEADRIGRRARYGAWYGAAATGPTARVSGGADSRGGGS
ncbi:hypothetical protein [Alistipes sp. CAG:268]|jgi:hypothetical protein|uniref:hypothetical protein n=1 Tax=Alistipes sp. CAG:268 TaxID=1262693 RepID=UPI0025C5E72A|nr:hypothetical protein [Alistipes sp. CAG:268]